MYLATIRERYLFKIDENCSTTHSDCSKAALNLQAQSPEGGQNSMSPLQELPPPQLAGVGHNTNKCLEGTFKVIIGTCAKFLGPSFTSFVTFSQFSEVANTPSFLDHF